MITTLCFDFGNTRQKVAVFNNDEIVAIEVLEQVNIPEIIALLEKYRPQKSILSSVIQHNPEIDDVLNQHTRFHRISAKSKVPFTTPVGKPESIGADRVAICTAAIRFYGGSHNLVIALGSCITYNFINKYNEFIGGSISPGMQMRFKAMLDYTAQLPEGRPDVNVPLMGYDTLTNLQGGVILGLAYEIDGFIDAYKAKFTKFNAILTGGDAIYLAKHLKNKIFADSELIFKGLYAISEQNN